MRWGTAGQDAADALGSRGTGTDLDGAVPLYLGDERARGRRAPGGPGGGAAPARVLEPAKERRAHDCPGAVHAAGGRWPRFAAHAVQAGYGAVHALPLRLRARTIGALNLEVGRSFGYWFDFGDDWWHQINVEAIDPTIPRGKFPKVINKEGDSPPQYADEEEEEDDD